MAGEGPLTDVPLIQRVWKVVNLGTERRLDYMHDNEVFHVGSVRHDRLLQKTLFTPVVIFINNMQILE